MKQLDLNKKARKIVGLTNKRVATASPAAIKSAESNPVYEQTVEGGEELILPLVQVLQSDGLTQQEVEYGNTIACNVCQTLNELVENSTAGQVADALDEATSPKKEDVKALICDIMTADFIASKTTAKVNEEIIFTPSASPNAEAFAFDFGDQTNAYGASAMNKSYSVPGTYSVEMLAGNISIGKRIAKSNYITVQGLANLKATYFNGINQWGTVAHHPDFNFGSGDFTIAMTVTPYTLQANLKSFMEKMASGFGTGWMLSQFGSDIRIYINSGASYLNVPNVLQINQPHHFVFTRKSGLVTAYINGQLISSTGHSASISQGEALLIGRHDGTSNTFFNGLIDEVSIFNEGFTAVEVSEHYNDGDTLYLPAFSLYTNAIAWWRMGDGDTAPIIKDQIGTKDIVLTNMDISNFVDV